GILEQEADIACADAKTLRNGRNRKVGVSEPGFDVMTGLGSTACLYAALTLAMAAVDPGDAVQEFVRNIRCKVPQGTLLHMFPEDQEGSEYTLVIRQWRV